ncbi:hypothetical protein MBLNU230_g6487t1 [Neophaeotheca triangularis]
MLLPTTIGLLILSTLASAAKLTVSIAASPILPNPATLPPSTHAVLLGPPGVRHQASLRTDNSFQFAGLVPASYLLTVHSHGNFFNSFRVDVSSAGLAETAQETVEVWQTFRGNEWNHKGPSIGKGNGEVDVQVRATGEKQFYQVRGGFNLLGFLKSPMILMGLFSVAMIFGMPYLMANMDEETKAEFEEMQKKSSLSGSEGAASQIQNFDLASWMAGSGGSNGGGSGSGSKKR